MVRFVYSYGVVRAVWSYKPYVVITLLGYSLLIILLFHTRLLVNDDAVRTGTARSRAKPEPVEPIRLFANRSESRRPTAPTNGSTSTESFSATVTGARHRESPNRDQANDRSFPLVEDCLPPATTTEKLRKEIAFQKLGDHYLYSAYFDDRETNGFPVVRIIALLKKSDDQKRFYCHVPQDGAKQSERHIKSRSSATGKTERREKPGSSNTLKSIVSDDDPDNSANGKHFAGDDDYSHIGASVYEMCENHNKDYGGWILSCRLTSPVRSPPCEVLVSLTNTAARLDNTSAFVFVRMPVFRVRNARRSKDQSFGVCVPPLFGHIPSTTLVEFVEFSQILGVEHFVFYHHEISTEISKVLRYYAARGIVTAIRWDLPVEGKLVWYHGQLVAINDCLYRSMHAFRYLSFNDVDEFIVPHVQLTWAEMVAHLRRHLATTGAHQSSSPPLPPLPRDGDSLKSRNGSLRPGDHHRNRADARLTKPGVPLHLTHHFQDYAGYSFESAFFDPLLSGLISHVLYDLESDLRTKAFSRVRSKVMVRPEAIFELGIHHVSRTLTEDLGIFQVPTGLAFVHHYRKCVSEFDPLMSCQVFAHDESLSRYIPTIRHNIHQTLWRMKETPDAAAEAAAAGGRDVRSQVVALSIRRSLADLQDGL